MSYFDGPNKGYGWAAGHFLVDDENCTRVTCLVPADHPFVQERDNGRKVVPAGAYITGKGFLYEDVDVTEGAKMGSVVTGGLVYYDLLPDYHEHEGIIPVEDFPTVTRPY